MAIAFLDVNLTTIKETKMKKLVFIALAILVGLAALGVVEPESEVNNSIYESQTAGQSPPGSSEIPPLINQGLDRSLLIAPHNGEVELPPEIGNTRNPYHIGGGNFQVPIYMVIPAPDGKMRMKRIFLRFNHVGGNNYRPNLVRPTSDVTGELLGRILANFGEIVRRAINNLRNLAEGFENGVNQRKNSSQSMPGGISPDDLIPFGEPQFQQEGEVLPYFHEEPITRQNSSPRYPTR
jgi:hypothetical protein